MIDGLDARLIELFTEEPRIGVLECSRRLGVARGTVQARLDRLAERGVIKGFGPEIDPVAIGYGVTAFVTLQIRQVGGHDPVADRLAGVPEVIEAHTITGTADMLCRVVARDTMLVRLMLLAVSTNILVMPYLNLMPVFARDVMGVDVSGLGLLLVDVEGVERASTVISLATQVPYRTLPLVRAVGGGFGGPDA